MKPIASTDARAECAHQPLSMAAPVDPRCGTRCTLRAAFVLLAVALLASGHALAQPVLAVSADYLGFGRVPVNVTSPVQPLFVMNTGDAPLTLQALTLGGASSTHYAVGGTCAAGQQLVPNARCRIDAVLRPTAVGSRLASLTIEADAAGTPAVVTLGGLGDGGTNSVAPPNPDPDWIDFGANAVGTAAAPRTLTFRNDSGIELRITSLRLQTGESQDFTLASSCNADDLLPNGSTCTFTFGFTPSGAGLRTTVLYLGVGYAEVTTGVVYIMVTGVGGTLAPSPYVEAAEYYHSAFDHYFVTAIADEIRMLDAGDFAGWARTGRSINVYPVAAAGLVTVCRFFSTSFGPRSSHFYTALADECALVLNNPDWTFEGHVFPVGLPLADGTCEGASIPVYRLYNDGMGGAPNHRFTTDRELQERMRAQGWIAEGQGVGVAMCAMR